jgi:hypothetical protein
MHLNNAHGSPEPWTQTIEQQRIIAVPAINPPLPGRRRLLSTACEFAGGLINGFFEWFGNLGIFSGRSCAQL